MRRSLGKGLSQLIAEDAPATPVEAALEDLVPNRRQPRTAFDEASLRELAASLKEHGMLQPISVRPLPGGKYEIIAGERRYRAAKIAGLRTAPIVLRAADNRESLELALVENLQREDITPMECARAYRRLIDEFGLSQEQVAEKVGKGRTSITNTLRLLRLPKRIQEAIESGELSEGHARALLALPNEAHMAAVFDRILAQGMSVRDVEKISQTQAGSKGRSTPSRPVPRRSVEDQSLEEAISTHFGSPSRLSRSVAGGLLSIEFYSDDDLQRILDILGVSL